MGQSKEKKIMQTMEHMINGYFRPFLSSLESMVIYLQDEKVFIHDKVTGHCWSFKLSLIDGKNPLEVRDFMRDFLLKETWEKCCKSEYFVTVISQPHLN